MRSRRCAIVAGALLLLVVLAALPVSAVEQADSCAALPWETAATVDVSPIEQGQTDFLWKAISCTSTAQCPVGQNCHCGKCHNACATGFRWNCVCQTCYQCPTGYFFDATFCACAPI